MKRYFTRTLVMMILFVLLVPVVYAATGAAFVHGKGDETLANSQVAWNYWTTDMLRASTLMKRSSDASFPSPPP